MVGLVVCGVGLAAMVQARLGLGPWDVLHQGIAERVDLGIGAVTVLTGVVVLGAWVPLRQRPGIGTVANALLIGLVTDATLAVTDPPEAAAARWVLVVGGVALFGVGGGLYIGAGLGPGPRDGLMTGLTRVTGRSIASVRTALELGTLVVGWLLGGSVGVGTVLFAFGIGPMLQAALGRLTIPAPSPAE